MAQAWVMAQVLVGIMARQPTTSAPATRFFNLFKNHPGGEQPKKV
jgi:hypothetical protein